MRNVIIGDAAAGFVRIVLARYTAPAVKDVFGIALVILVGDGRNITFFIIGISCDSPAILYLYLNDAAS